MDHRILELALEALERKKAEVVADIETVRAELNGDGFRAGHGMNLFNMAMTFYIRIHYFAGAIPRIIVDDNNFIQRYWIGLVYQLS